MSWLDLFPTCCLAVATLIIPGLVIAMGWRIRPLVAISAAPALSMTVLVFSGWVAAQLGSSWSVWWIAGMTVCLAVLGLLATMIPLPGGQTREPINHHRETRHLLTYLTGIATMAILLLPHVLPVFRAPDAVNQRYDNAFHALAIRHIAETAIASPFSLHELGPTFYPTGWHTWNALVVMLTHVSVSSAIQACSLALIFVIWPLSLIGLCETVWTMNSQGRLLLGPLALASTSFPFALIDFGSLYPNMMGFAMAPILLTAVWNFFSLAEQRLLSVSDSIVIGILALPGVTLSHPNGTLSSAAVVILPALVAAVTRLVVTKGEQRRPQILWMIVTLVFSATVIAVWLKVTVSMTSHWLASETMTQTIGEVLTGTTMAKTVIWPLSAGLIVGLLVALRTRHERLVLLAFVTSAVLYVAANGFPKGMIRALLTRVYYADAYRPAAFLAIVTILIAVRGWMAIVGYVTRHIRRRSSAATESVASLILTVILAVGIIHNPGMAQQMSNLSTAFIFDETSNLLTPDEQALIDRLGNHVPAGETLIVNPYQGGGFAYVRGGYPLQSYFVSTPPDADTAYLNDHLNALNEDPRICSILNDKDIHYVLVLDAWHVNDFRRDSFTGLEGLDSIPGFAVLDKQGTSKLYEITGCQSIDARS